MPKKKPRNPFADSYKPNPVFESPTPKPKAKKPPKQTATAAKGKRAPRITAPRVAPNPLANAYQPQPPFTGMYQPQPPFTGVAPTPPFTGSYLPQPPFLPLDVTGGESPLDYPVARVAAVTAQAAARGRPSVPPMQAATPGAPPVSPAPAAPAAPAGKKPPPKPPPKPPANKSTLDALVEQILAAYGAYKPPTLAELTKQAQQIAQNALAPFQTELARERQAAIDDYNRRVQHERDRGAALAGIYKDMVPGIQKTYQDAAGQNAAIAKGYSDGFRMAAEKSATASNELIARAGGPAEQQIQAGPGSPSDAGGNVLFGLGGAIPSQAMLEAGAGFTNAARFGEPSQLRLGEIRANTVQEEADRKRAAFDAQMRELLMQKPSLVQGALSELQKAAGQQEALQQNRLLLPVMLAQAREKFGGVSPLTGEPTAAERAFQLQIGNQKIRVNQINQGVRKWLTDSRGWFVDPETGQVTLTPEAKRIILAQQKAKQLPAAERGKRAESSAKAAALAFNGYWADPNDPRTPIMGQDLQKRLADESTDDPQEAGLGFYHNTYQEVLNNLLAKGTSIAIARKALHRYWKTPGQHMEWEMTKAGYPSGAGRPKGR